MVRQKSIAKTKSRRKPKNLEFDQPSSSAPSSSKDISSSCAGARPHPSGNIDVTDRRQRKRADTVALHEGQPRQNVATLKLRLQYIRQDVIRKKWNVLPEPYQVRIKGLFTSIERPVIASYRDGRQRIEAQKALNSITKILDKRLPLMPFPTNTQEAHLDYEGILQSNRSLEQQLTSSLHNIAMLKAKVSQEEKISTKEVGRLNELRKNAKDEEDKRQHRGLQTKRYLPLQVQEAREQIDDQPNSIGLEIETREDAFISKSHPDPGLHAVIGPLQNHLESMGSNVSQVMGIGDALLKANSTIDGFLQRTLSSHKGSRLGLE